MSIVKHLDKKSGRIYAYESTPHYDPRTKQQRPKRKYLGVYDPVTDQIIPSAGKRGRRPGVKDSKPREVKPKDTAESLQQLNTLTAELQLLRKKYDTCIAERDSLKRELQSANRRLTRIAGIALEGSAEE